MNYQEVLQTARESIIAKCKVCKVCNGVACRGEIPGPGGKGTGSSFVRNSAKIDEIKLNMDTLYGYKELDTSVELFGKQFKYPVFAAPIGGLNLHYSGKLNDTTYSEAIINGCKKAGIAGFTGDGTKPENYDLPLKAVLDAGGWGIPTVKPWGLDEVLEKVEKAEKGNTLAVAMDIDAAGLPILGMQGKPVRPKSMEELKQIIGSTRLPFILKGIMTVKGALKAADAGAYGIVVSNHGGRVLDHTPATVEVLPEIAKAVRGKVKIFIDGGIRSGMDVLKVLALGADAVLIGRPYAVAAYGGGSEGVALYSEKIGGELREAMIMTGASRLADINEDMIFRG